MLLRRLQRDDSFGPPHSRPMPAIGPRCHELRISDEAGTWRIIYRIDPDAVVIGEVFSKRTRPTSKPMIDVCKRRFSEYDAIARGKG
ncbi:MAG TPA: type II toxin-antitoxin system RelE/ParE family toxin [Coriobacteriia bacterium]|nr:type II toxin-antitoxin system RelE/ParE family toxin [Coriobacteriia bacterium]